MNDNTGIYDLMHCKKNNQKNSSVVYFLADIKYECNCGFSEKIVKCDISMRRGMCGNSGGVSIKYRTQKTNDYHGDFIDDYQNISFNESSMELTIFGSGSHAKMNGRYKVILSNIRFE